MMLFRVGQLPIWVVLFLVGATSARAESELQKFQSTIPPGLRLATASYEACASVAAIDAKRGNRDRQISGRRGENCQRLR
jgi:hypothetical protein